MKRYLVILSLVAAVFVNLPLIVLVCKSVFDVCDSTYLRIAIMQNPHQYLFHLIVFPFVILTSSIAGYKIWRYIHENQTLRKHWLGSLNGILGLCLLIGVSSVSVGISTVLYSRSTFDLTDLEGQYANVISRAYENTLEYRRHLGYIDSLDFDSSLAFIDNVYRREVTFDTPHSDSRTHPIVFQNNVLRAYLQSFESNEWESLLNDTLPIYSNSSLRDSLVIVLYTQFFSDGDLLIRADSIMEGQILGDIINFANAVELSSGMIVAGHVAIWIFTLALIRRFNQDQQYKTDSPVRLPYELNLARSLLFTTIALVSLWIILHHYSLWERGFVMGREPSEFALLFPALILLLPSSIGLIYVQAPQNMLKAIGGIVPLIVGLASYFFTRSIVERPSMIVGVGADIGLLTLVVLAYAFVLGVWLTFLFSKTPKEPLQS